MISNQDNYLLLKQLMVVLQTLRLKGEVMRDHKPATIESVTASITQLLVIIEEDFTLPLEIVKGIMVGVDMNDFIDAILPLLEPIEDNDEIYDMVKETAVPANLNRCITEFPVMASYFTSHVENMASGQRWLASNELAIRLFHVIDKAIANIKEWVQGDIDRHLAQMVILVNCIELVDRMFAYFNDYYGAKDGLHS